MESTERQTNALGGTGVGLGASALGLFLLQALSGNGGILGGNRPPMEPPATQRDLAYERDLTEKDAKIGKLEAQLYTDQEINKLRQEVQAGAAVQQNFNATVSATLAATVKQTNELASVFGSYIKSPILSVSEAVMNAAKAAAAPASTTAGGAGE